MLEVCLAFAVDPSLGKLFGLLHGDEGFAYVSELLVARLHQRALPLLGASGAMRRWRIIDVGEAAPGEPAPLRLDPFVFGYISGSLAWDVELVGRVVQLAPQPPLEQWPVAEIAARVERAWDSATPVRLAVEGPHGSGRRTFSAVVGERLGLPMVAVDTNRLPDEEWPRIHLFAHRQALVLGHGLAWTGANAARAACPVPALAPLQVITGDPDIELTLDPNVATETVRLGSPSVGQRRALWTRHVPETLTWPEGQLDHVAERYRVQIGDILSIARRGPDGFDEVKQLCREVTRDRLGELGQAIPCPFGWDDLLIPERLQRDLQDFLYEARERTLFWEKPEAVRLFPRGRGLVGLMTGPPGTGKTMAAQVVAHELGLDLFRIDLASSVSKYIGETAKNLKKVFQRASEMNAVLLFDEADALFSKRTDVGDAHDRYANSDTNYLLQLLEDYPGIALLASNKRSNIDAAFVRRIRFILEFSRPSVAERAKIWRRLIAELEGNERAEELEPILNSMARVLELSGAQIKLAILAAVFAARRDRTPLSFEHLCRGVDRELGKEGRTVGAKERDRIQRGLVGQ